MDLTKAISYNSYTISGVTRTSGGIPAYGVQIEAVNFSDAEVTGYFDKSAIQDGVDSGDVYLGRRAMTIRASVFGSSSGDGYDRLQSFLAAFSPRLAYNADSANLGFLAFDFYQPTADISTWPTSTYPSGIPLRFYARPAALPSWSVRRDATGGVAGNGIAFDVSATLVMRDPRKYLQTESSITISDVSTKTITHRGDYPTFGIVTVTISGNGSSAFKVALNGMTATFDLSALVGPTYILDYEDRFFYLTSSGASRMAYLTSIDGWPEIPPDGTGTIRMYNSTAVTSCTLTYREAWA